MSARVLVTGASGNVGSEVIRACLQAGFTVRAAGRDLDKTKQAYPSVESVTFDFLDRQTWARALAETDFVFLLRPPPLGDMSTTLNPFIDTAIAGGVKHLVFMSVAGAESKTWVPHRKVEDHLRRTGTGWTVLRPGFFVQNLGDAYRRDLVNDDRFYLPAGDGQVAFLDVADIGDAVAAVLLNPTAHQGQALRLAGPEAVTFTQLAQRLSVIMGRTITYVPASIAGYVWHLWRHLELPLMQVVVQTVLHVGLRSGEAQAVDDVQLGLLGRAASSITGYLERSRALWAHQPGATPKRSNAATKRSTSSSLL